ncbi:MAG: hypothetical protein BWY43_00779 [candidate division WS2 bacterium ADurb.Bin280]|uniref:Uncharacterized protein n=1 Tax=candidate division WS2 bacterium ADurb.Bin280 TaxID=1852829 RepID=A0A1V5SCV9_9BACT|nr:MAG: hypothetical protein BWY43_00779 [candidate division WS2 bacterium ADurb.Bin280]
MVDLDVTYTIYTPISDEQIVRSLLGGNGDDRNVKVEIALDPKNTQEVEFRICSLKRSPRCNFAFAFDGYSTVDGAELYVEGIITKGGGSYGGHGLIDFSH